jgi:hypothetical protein
MDLRQLEASIDGGIHDDEIFVSLQAVEERPQVGEELVLQRSLRAIRTVSGRK